MLQDIEPHILHNEYKPVPVTTESYICIFSGDSILACSSNDKILLPQWKDILSWGSADETDIIFLFSVDELSFYLIPKLEFPETGRWSYIKTSSIRMMPPSASLFACALGGQLNRWYQKNRFCGHCGHHLTLHETERALLCESCAQVVYPSLSPSVIVAITHKNRILLTKYAGREYTRYALVAGYTEVGETLEGTVKREVYEEVGLQVKDIRYYKSQPWPFTDTLLVGFFAELDGSDSITLEEEELAEATWFERESIPQTASTLSLTNEMIEAFRHNIF